MLGPQVAQVYGQTQPGRNRYLLPIISEKNLSSLYRKLLNSFGGGKFLCRLLRPVGRKWLRHVMDGKGNKPGAAQLSGNVRSPALLSWQEPEEAVGAAAAVVASQPGWGGTRSASHIGGRKRWDRGEPDELGNSLQPRRPHGREGSGRWKRQMTSSDGTLELREQAQRAKGYGNKEAVVFWYCTEAYSGGIGASSCPSREYSP